MGQVSLEGPARAEEARRVDAVLGRVLPQPKGPGIALVFAPIDRMVRISLRVETLEVPAQDVVTRDNVTVKVNAVIYFRVVDSTKAVIEVTNFLYATSQLAQTTLLGQAAASPAQWSAFVRKYEAEMARPEARHDLELLAALSRSANFSVGC